MTVSIQRLASCLLIAGSLSQAAASDLGRDLAATCAGCHGTNGHALSGSGLAVLAGRDKNATLQKLADFKRGAQPATIMHQIAKGYTDEQLELIAEYFAGQK